MKFMIVEIRVKIKRGVHTNLFIYMLYVQNEMNMKNNNIIIINTVNSKVEHRNE
jgi:hypothetical protein